jgi:hypothetical protein
MPGVWAEQYGRLILVNHLPSQARTAKVDDRSQPRCVVREGGGRKGEGRCVGASFSAAASCRRRQRRRWRPRAVAAGSGGVVGDFSSPSRESDAKAERFVWVLRHKTRNPRDSCLFGSQVLTLTYF